MNIKKITVAVIATLAIGTVMAQEPFVINTGIKVPITLYERALVKIDNEETAAEGLEELKRVALDGFAPAIEYLAARYREDPVEFKKWGELGASKGIPSVMFLYGASILDKNDFEGLFWMEKAALQGLSEASHTVGYIYENGYRQIPANKDEAIYYYRLGVENNDMNAEAVDDCRKGLERLGVK